MKLIIFDFNRTLYDPVTQQLKEGAINLLKHAKASEYELALLSTGESVRKQLIKSLNLEKYFSTISLVVDKTEKDFKHIMLQYGARPEDVIVIGDNPESELLIGSRLGVKTFAVAGGLCSQERAAQLGATYCLDLQEIPHELN